MFIWDYGSSGRVHFVRGFMATGSWSKKLRNHIFKHKEKEGRELEMGWELGYQLPLLEMYFLQRDCISWKFHNLPKQFHQLETGVQISEPMKAFLLNYCIPWLPISSWSSHEAKWPNFRGSHVFNSPSDSRNCLNWPFVKVRSKSNTSNMQWHRIYIPLQKKGMRPQWGNIGPK